MRVNIKNYNIDSNIEKNIILISDIHYSKNYKIERLDLILNKIKKLNPDYICIAGDLVDIGSIENSHIDKFISWLQELAEICNVMAVLGNHDVEIIKDNKRMYGINKYYINELKKIKNFYLLQNQNYEADINFIGYEIPYNYYRVNENTFDKKNIKYVKDKLNILLTHDPSFVFLNINDIDAQLILCGHTHGGLMPDINIGHRGIISPNKKIFPKNMRGIYNLGNTNLIISSGIIKLSETSHLYKLNDIYSMSIVNIKLNMGNKIKKHIQK